MGRGPAALLLAFVLAGCLTAPSPGPPAAPGGPAGPSWPWANVQVTTTNGPASEVTVARNPADPLNLVGGAKDYTLGTSAGCDEYNVWSGVYWSRDGGATWGNALMPGHPGDANPGFLSRYRCNSDPVVAFGSDGTAYYSGLAYGGGEQSAGGSGACPGDEQARLCGRSIWTARSADGGETWEAFVNVAVSDDRRTILDKQWFAVDPNDPATLVMTWIHFAAFGGGFYIAISVDGARSWSPPLPLAELGGPIHQFAMPAFGPDGSVYVIWNNFGAPFLELPVPSPVDPFASSLMFTKNTRPGTPSFTPARPVSTIRNIDMDDVAYRTNSIPVLAVAQEGPNAGHLYVVWPDQQGEHADIVFTKSLDGGETWSAPAKVNHEAIEGDQFMAWLAVDEEGGLGVVFYDRSYDASGAMLGITLARSTDEGATWNQVRVTDVLWEVPEGCYHQRGFPFIGDYIGLAAGHGTLHPFWADGRTGRCEVFTAQVPYAALGGSAGAGAPGLAAERADATRMPTGMVRNTGSSS